MRFHLAIRVVSFDETVPWGSELIEVAAGDALDGPAGTDASRFERGWLVSSMSRSCEGSVKKPYLASCQDRNKGEHIDAPVNVAQNGNFLFVQFTRLFGAICECGVRFELAGPTGANPRSGALHTLLVSVTLDTCRLQLRIGVAYMKCIVVLAVGRHEGDFTPCGRWRAICVC